MNIAFVTRLRFLIQALGAQSISIGTGPKQVALTCIPSRLEALDDIPGLATRTLGQEFLAIGNLENAQVMWAGPQGMGHAASTLEPIGWTRTEFVPGVFDPVFSLLLTGNTIDTTGWAHSFDVEPAYLNCSQVESGLQFSIGDISGQVIYDDSLENLVVAHSDELTPLRQACHLLIWVRDGQIVSDPLVIHQELARFFQEKFLKASQNFPASQVRTAVDLEGLKTAAQHPQDLAALLGLGLRFKPNLERQEIGWEVDRYLANPIVLAGYDATACIEADLPIAPAEFAPDWAQTFVPTIPETLPKTILKKTDHLGVYLVESSFAGELSLPYLLVQPGCRLMAGGVEQSPDRPVLLLARNGRKAAGIAGNLAGRDLFLRAMLKLFGEMRTLERQEIVLGRYPFRFDPLLAALWLVGNAINLTRGEAASIGRLRKSVLSVSLTMSADIEFVRKKKPDPAVDQALAQALQALRAKREKLIGRLSKAAKAKETT